MTKLKNLIFPLLVAVVLASAAHGAFYEWSKTAGSNSTADSTINWAEGQSPSSVNDSARAVMARLAEYRDDISGVLLTTGSASAFTLTTNQGLAAAPTDGQMIAFTPHVTNTASASLQVDSGNIYPLQTAPGVAVGAGVIILGTPYHAKFRLASNAWILFGAANPYNVPIGGVMAYTGSTAPNANFVLSYGQCISRTTYAIYFALVSTTYGVCDGSTTFGVPDLRGRMVAGKDDMGGTAASRLTTTYYGTAPTTLGNAGGAQSKTLATAEIPAHSHAATTSITDPGHVHTTNAIRYATADQVDIGTGVIPVIGSFTATIDSATTGITATTTTSNTGGGTAFAIVPPALILNYIIRIQ